MKDFVLGDEEEGVETNIPWNKNNFCAITKVIVESGVTSIGASAFATCIGLTSVTIPNSLSHIGNYAFQSCIGLTSITIPSNVTSIGVGAFLTTGLTSVTILNPTPPKIEQRSAVFHGVNTEACILYVPKGSSYGSANVWKEFKNIKFIQ
jgi:hypothetical protein